MAYQTWQGDRPGWCRWHCSHPPSAGLLTTSGTPNRSDKHKCKYEINHQHHHIFLAQKKKRNLFQFMKAWNISGPDQHMAWEPHWSHQWSQVDQSPHWTHARRVEWPSMRKDDYMVYNLYTILYTIINQAGENSSICSANIYNSCQPGSVTQCDSVCTGQCKAF